MNRALHHTIDFAHIRNDHIQNDHVRNDQICIEELRDDGI
jgi:hypothetical protein